MADQMMSKLRRGERGFTLIEMVLVLILLVLLAGLVMQWSPKLSVPDSEVRRQVSLFIARLAHARQQAILHHEDVSFTLKSNGQLTCGSGSCNTSRFLLDGDTNEGVPEGSNIKFTALASDDDATGTTGSFTCSKEGYRIDPPYKIVIEKTKTDPVSNKNVVVESCSLRFSDIGYVLLQEDCK